MPNPKFRIYLDVELVAGTPSLSAKEYAAEVERTLLHAIGDGLLSSPDPVAEIEEYSVRSKVLSEGSDPTIPAGTRVRVSAYTCESGEGLSYPAMEAVLSEDCVPGSWDVVELDNGESVYAFSISRIDEQKPAKCRPAMPSPNLLREWAQHPDNQMCWGLDALADFLESLDSDAVDHAEAADRHAD